jgi:rhamnosyltransferase
MAFWVDGRKVLIRKSQAQKKWDFLFEAAGPGCTYVLKNKLAAAIKKTIVANWHDIQEVYLHDWFCYAFARANDYKWFVDAEPKVFYRQHENNQVGINSGVRSLLARLRKVVNGYGLEQSKLIGNLIGLGDDDFFMSWSGLRRIDKLKLAFCAMNCRRRFRDQIYFFLVCVFLALKPNKLKC